MNLNPEQPKNDDENKEGEQLEVFSNEGEKEDKEDEADESNGGNAYQRENTAEEHHGEDGI